MTVALTQTVTPVVGDSSSITYNAGSNFTAGTTVVFLASAWPSTSGVATDVHIAGVVATLVASRDAGGGDITYIWAIANNPGARKDVVIGAGAGGALIGSILEISGMPTALSVDSHSAQASGTSAAPASGSTGTLDQDLGIGFTLWSNSTNGDGSITAPIGFTLAYSGDGSFEGGAGAYEILVATTALNPVWATAGLLDWAAITYVLKGTVSTQTGAPQFFATPSG